MKYFLYSMLCLSAFAANDSLHQCRCEAIIKYYDNGKYAGKEIINHGDWLRHIEPRVKITLTTGKSIYAASSTITPRKQTNIIERLKEPQ